MDITEQHLRSKVIPWSILLWEEKISGLAYVAPDKKIVEECRQKLNAKIDELGTAIEKGDAEEIQRLTEEVMDANDDLLLKHLNDWDIYQNGLKISANADGLKILRNSPSEIQGKSIYYWITSAVSQAMQASIEGGIRFPKETTESR